MMFMVQLKITLKMTIIQQLQSYLKSIRKGFLDLAIHVAVFRVKLAKTVGVESGNTHFWHCCEIYPDILGQIF